MQSPGSVAFTILGIDIMWYGILITSGIILAAFICCKRASKHGITSDTVLNFVIICIPVAIIGARLYYVVFNWSYYAGDILRIINTRAGGLAIHGGIIGGVITILVYSKKHNKKINEIIKYMDICTFGLILGQIIGRWGNFFNSEAHGGETTRLFLEKIHIPSFIINGMYINGIYYHPTFFYESILNLIGLITLLIVRKNKNIKNGMLLSIYLIWYSIVRFFIEALRTDSLMLGTLKMAQVISIILFITGIIIFIISLKKGNYYNERKN